MTVRRATHACHSKCYPNLIKRPCCSFYILCKKSHLKYDRFLIFGKVPAMHFVVHTFHPIANVAFIVSLLFFPTQTRSAQNSPDPILKVVHHIVDDTIVPAYDDFAQKAQNLADTVGTHCSNPRAQQAFRDAFLAWQMVQHLHLEPSQTSNRQHRIQFWPIPRTSGSDS